MDIDDILDDSVDNGVNINDALQTLINGQKTMIAEIEKKQTHDKQWIFNFGNFVHHRFLTIYKCL